ncbi:MAG: bifunctional folylpolyglutamate synthase/dihydrofolate synthase [Ruminococcaceae bacterium]|nr:bifunctional folylpolyglutamate synthase/dihydrofolate synthase [Oscillospiraceae bacterium]
MNVNEALEYIHSVSWKGSVPGLERTRELLALMGNPQDKLKFIHIAGTNGKGSTALMTSNILIKAGYKTGLYTSPYIFEFNERMRVDGVNISDEELGEITEFIKPLAESMQDKPTEFELVTCIGFEYFKRHSCDIVCLEVGMGGELDSTNVISSPVASVITNIGLDHTDFLGDTVEKIATTKSKIIKENSSAVVYPNSPEVEKIFKDRCKEVNSDFYLSDFNAVIPHSHTLDEQIFSWKYIENIKLKLLGEHQLKNVATVLTLVEVLRLKGYNITDHDIKEGIEASLWQGRFEVLTHDPLFIVDGGHNPQCIASLLENVKSYVTKRPLIILTGVLRDKDFDSMYRDFVNIADEFVTVTVPNPRTLPAEDLAKYLTSLNAKATSVKTIPEGVTLAKEKAGKNGAVVAFGSLYMVSDIEKSAVN